MVEPGVGEADPPEKIPRVDEEQEFR